MYLNGSNWNLRKRRRRSRPWRILLLVVLIAAVSYFWRIYVPSVPPLFVPTPTATRSPASYILEAESLFEAGKLYQSELAYLEAIAIQPRETAYYIDLARVRVFAGKYEEAEQAARDALVLNPDDALAHGVLGWALDFRAGQMADPLEREQLLTAALTSVERGLELNPSAPLIYAYYAEVLIDNNINAYEDALQAASRSVELDPGLLEAHRALGYVWEMTGNYELAVESYEIARQINPNLPRLYIDLGTMMRALGDVESAVDNYLNAVALAPTSTEPLILVAEAYASVGEFGKASQFAQDAVDLDPTNARLHGNLGRMFYHNNVYDEAIAQLQLAITGGVAEDGSSVQGVQLDPGDSRVIEFYYTYGLALARTSRCDEAVPVFEVLIRGVPDNEIAVFNAQEGLRLCAQEPLIPEAETPTPTPEP